MNWSVWHELIFCQGIDNLLQVDLAEMALLIEGALKESEQKIRIMLSYEKHTLSTQSKILNVSYFTGIF